MNDRILDKIKKCLALAGSSNPNEAETAWRQARKLMDTYRLEMKDIHASEACTTRQSVGKRPPVWLLALAQACAKAFNCRVITESSFRKSQIVFIGIGDSPQFSEYAFIALRNQLRSARTTYVATLSRCKLATKRRRGEIFSENWVAGVHSAVMKFAETDEDTNQILDAYFEKNLPSLTTRTLESRKVVKRDYTAAHAGYESGRKAKLHKAVNQSSRISIGQW